MIMSDLSVAPDQGGDDQRHQTTTTAGAPAPSTGADRPSTHAGHFLRLSLRPVLIYLASRAGVLMVAGAVATDTNRTVSKGLVAWDAQWYLSIAQFGYAHAIPPGSGNPAQTNLGFFPLLPILTRGTHEVTRLGYSASGLVTTFVLGLLASVAVWWLLHDVFGQTGADRGTALVLFSPGAFVLSLVYTEGATIVLVACTLLALRRRRWLLAGVCAGLASAADPVAVAVIVPCVVASVLAIRSAREWRSLIAPVLAPAGVVAFFAYLWVHNGTPFEWFRAQRAGWQGGSYFGSVPQAFVHLVDHGFADRNFGVKAVTIMATVGLLVLFFRARPPKLWVSYVVAVLFLGCLSPLIGVTPRLLLRCFPLLGVVGARLPPFWYELVLGFMALCGAALAMMAMGSPLWTP
jgi:hypothetical protein